MLPSPFCTMIIVNDLLASMGGLGLEISPAISHGPFELYIYIFFKSSLFCSPSAGSAVGWLGDILSLSNPGLCVVLEEE